MSQLAQRMLVLAQRFAGFNLQERRDLQRKMIAQGLSLDALPIPPRAAGLHVLPASYAQQRLWLLWQLAPQSSAYNQLAVLRLRGELDVTALQRSIEQLISRHEVLRTRFALDGQRVMQHVQPHHDFVLQQMDWSAEPAPSAERLDRAVAREAQRPFDLERGALLRATLIKVAEGEHVLLFCTHHIVTDAWSMPILVDEVTRVYRHCVEGGSATLLPPLAVHYADFAAWQRLWLEAGEAERQLGYWCDRLGSEPVNLDLPLDRPRPQERSAVGGREEIVLDPATSAALQRLAVHHGTTLFTVLLASFHALLHRYSGAPVVRIGTPIANRTRAEVEDLIGFFVNTQVLQAEVDGLQSFAQLIDQVKARVLEAQAHQDLPFEQLVDALQPERSLNQNALFQVLFNHLVGRDDSRSWNLPGLEVEALDAGAESVRFDLTLNTFEQSGSVRASLVYARDLFDASTIARMAAHWRNLLQAALNAPARPIGELAMLDAEELARATRHWNATELALQGAQSVHRLIEAHAAQSPEAIALVCGEQAMSYRQLNQRANRLAHRLVEAGLAPEQLVGIVAERSIELAVGLLAVLKAGGAYVVLDPQSPRQRLAQLLEDGGISRLLVQPAVQAHVQGLLVDTWALDAEAQAADAPNLTSSAGPLALAYMIFTSGSTGRAKGVMVSHGALVNYLAGIRQRLPIEDIRSMALTSTVAADLGYTVLFGALCNGKSLHLISAQMAVDGAEFARYMQRHRIDMLKIVPSHFAALLGDSHAAVIPARCLVLGGEACAPGLIALVQRLAPDCQVLNHYGPTECTVGALTHAVEPGAALIPLGRPLANLRSYVLDATGQPVAVGCVGELHLAGAGLARGYHRRAGLTAQQFVPDPFGPPGSRLYRSGDRVRQCADGTVAFVGRIDHQVKIRGYRVELGEVESCLLSHPTVRECVVLAQDGVSGQQLVGYVVPNGAPDLHALKLFLHERLPAHQVPARLLALSAMPLTPNGKLDRKALPVAEMQADQTQHRSAETPLQAQLVAIWEDVLGRRPVGITDNFFELGGDSIVAIQMVSRARQAQIRIASRDVFRAQTILALSGLAVSGAQASIDQAAVSGAMPLLPIAQGFFAADIAQCHHWNQSVLLTPREVIAPAILRQALEWLVQQHDALRLRYRQGAAGWQAWHAEADLEQLLWLREATDAGQIDTIGAAAQASLSLEGGQLMRAVLIDLADASQRLLLVIHHLVVDGISWRVLLEDLQTLCRQLRDGQTPSLPPKSHSFQYFSEQLQHYARSAPVVAELAYWQAQLAGVDGDLPRDNPHGSQLSRHGVEINQRLGRELTRQLLQQAPATYRTHINDLLLTALARVICRWTGAPHMLVRLEGHGREEIAPDLDIARTVGWFTTLFPVKLTPLAGDAECIKSIKEQLRGVPGNGIGFGALRYLGDDAARAALHALASPRVTFNYLGQFDQSFDGEALFVPASEAAGEVRDADAPLGNWLTVSGQVYGGELSLGWNFSEQVFQRGTIQALADAYLEELAALVRHCCATTEHAVTPSDFVLAGLDQAQLDSLPVAVQEIADILPLTAMQQGMLFHSLFDPQGSAYINQMRFDVLGLHVEPFRQAWQAALDRHEVLRASFHWQNTADTPVQIIHQRLELPLACHDWSTRADRAMALEQLAQADLAQGFNLSQAPLMRLHVIDCGGGRWHVIHTAHHILMDGWSSSRLLGEVLQGYAGVVPASAAGGYRDYLHWLARQDPLAGEAFWTPLLANLDGPVRLGDAFAHSTPAHAGEFAEHLHCLEVAATERLKHFARQQKVTVNTLLQAAWLLLLKRYTGQQCVTFGATVSGRPGHLPGIESQLGLFINTLPVIATPQPQATVAEWIDQVQALNVALRDFEHTPLYDIQRWAGRPGEALFDTLLVFENYPVSEALLQGADSGLTFSAVSKRERTNYPLTLAAGLEQQLSLHYSFATERFSAAVIETLNRQLLQLLGAFCDDAAQALGNLQLAGVEQPVVDAQAPCFATMVQRFAAQVKKSPEAQALQFVYESMTYTELNAQANRLAHKLRELGVGPDVLVGIALERGPQMVVGLLAILKAGGAYVPMDPQYPAERLAHMIEDSGLHLLLTQAHLRDSLPIPAGVAALDIDADWSGYSATDPQVALDPQHLAYVIYTSGSTGKPKGVSVRHEGVANFLASMSREPGITAGDRVLALTSLSFDIAGLELYAPLIEGACLVLVSGADTKDPQALIRLIVANQVSLVQATPSTWRMLLDAQNAVQLPACKVLCGGEALPADLAQRLIARFGHVWNLYGPTETTIWSAIHRLDATQPKALLGKAIDHTNLYVLDSDLQPVPRGVVGELYIGGIGLARGYHRRAGLTAERFMADPFTTQGARMYRSGDLVRISAEGLLDYVGRADHQVKIRGFRIELGEIETRLQAQEGVREAVVVAHDNVLSAYLVPLDPTVTQLDAGWREQLKAALRRELPDFMLPSHWMLLARMPHTPNGKLDRKALPRPNANLLLRTYEAPQSQLEQQVAGIWQDVLKLQRVGLNDNFFELGGHSLLATQATARVQIILGSQVPLALLFNAGSLKEYAARIGEHLNPQLSEDLSDMHEFMTELELN